MFWSNKQLKRLLEGLFGYNPIPLHAFIKNPMEDDEALLRIYIPEAIGNNELLPKVVDLAETIAKALGLTQESDRLGIKCYLHPARGVDECIVIWEVSDREAVDGIGGYYIAYYYDPERKEEGK